MRVLLLFGLILITSISHADNIAFGKLKAIKVYDFSNNKVTKLYFKGDATSQQVEGCGAVATMTHSLHSADTIKQFTSIALAAYVAGKKIRAHSSGNTCELDFLALQESEF